VDTPGRKLLQETNAHHVIENRFGGKAEWWNIWVVVEISAEVNGFKVLSADFSSFILDKLVYVKGLVDWRADN
jgi:hypothetical protein